MKKRVLGKTGVEVSELALDGLFISSVGMCPYLSWRCAL